MTLQEALYYVELKQCLNIILKIEKYIKNYNLNPFVRILYEHISERIEL